MSVSSYAVVLAETVAQAVDAAEMIWADIEPLDAVVTIQDAMAEDILLFPDLGTNRSFQMPSRVEGDVTDGCEVVVQLEFTNPRLSVAPIEPRATVAAWDHDHLTVWACTQFPHRTRDGFVAAFGLAPEQCRVITPDVGGGFGGKNANYVEDFVVGAAARASGRPVRWVETRSESMTNLSTAAASTTELRSEAPARVTFRPTGCTSCRRRRLSGDRLGASDVRSDHGERQLRPRPR